ncbi:spermidine synthase [Streptococcus pneumoniae]|nr:spermidine synthase [Streptococcus pneumoniae]
MDLWFSEVHTPDVKLSLRTAKQLYAGKSEWQDIEVLDTPAFGKILILNGHVLFSLEAVNRLISISLSNPASSLF